MRLTEPEKRARERMRLVQPETAYKVLGHPRYWTTPFVDLFIKRCDAVSRSAPHDAAHMAEQLPVLVSRIRVEDAAGSYATEAQKRSALALAHVVRDHLCQRAGQTQFTREDAAVLERLARQGLDRRVVAERLKRRALPVFQEGDWVGALRMLNQAIEIAGSKHPRIVREAWAGSVRETRTGEETSLERTSAHAPASS